MTNVSFHQTLVHDNLVHSNEDIPLPRGSSSTTVTAVNFNTSSAACLLVMDDNHRLVEWLAYHYFTMNLRYVIVAVDPRSSTSPEAILDRFEDLGYQIWTDDDYMGNRVFDKRQRLFELGRKQLTMVHRVRQKAFYQFCLERLDQLQAGWTLLLDVDEYLVINHDKVNQSEVILSQPGGLYRFVKETSERASQQPSLEQFHSPCVTIPRLLFGAQEANPTVTTTTTTTTTKINLPQNNIYLDTTRWFYHAYYSEFDRNGLAKTIVNLHRITLPQPHFPAPVNPHRPFADLCRDPKKILEINQFALLRVHHYLSTWETYSFRNDSRKGAERSREAWEYRAYPPLVGPNLDIVSWLSGFVQYYGIQEATRLLQGAGLPPTYTHPPAVEGQWAFEFVDEFLDPIKNPQQYESKYGKFLQNRTQSMQNKK